MGTVYLDVHKLPEGLGQGPGPGQVTEQQRRSSFYGYSFERLATEPGPSGRSTGGGAGEGRGGEGPIDANEEYCNVVKTKIGVYRVLMGAEIDCCDRESSGEGPWEGVRAGVAAGAPGKRRFVELKCSAEPDNPEKLLRFERDKMLRFYIQSYLAGVPTVVCGFRDRHGKLTRVARWNIQELTLPAKEKRLWEAGPMLAFTQMVLDWLYGTVEDGKDYVLRFSPQFSRMELLEGSSCPAAIQEHVALLQDMGVTA